MKKGNVSSLFYWERKKNMKNPDKELLKAVYQNSQTAVKAVSYAAENTENSDFFDCLFVILGEYRKILCDTAALLEEMREIPKKSLLNDCETGFTLRIAALNKKGSMAKALITGGREGISDLCEKINCFPSANEKTVALAFRLLRVEKRAVDELEGFLGKR